MLHQGDQYLGVTREKIQTSNQWQDGVSLTLGENSAIKAAGWINRYISFKKNNAVPSEEATHVGVYTSTPGTPSTTTFKVKGVADGTMFFTAPDGTPYKVIVGFIYIAAVLQIFVVCCFLKNSQGNFHIHNKSLS